MDEDICAQSAWQRARRDTGNALHTIRFWAAEVIAMPISGAAAAIIAPSNWSDALSNWFGVGIALLVASLLVVMILIGSLILAPYRIKRDIAQRRKEEVDLLKSKLHILEEERITRIACKPSSGRRDWDWQHERLMWAELQVTNTSPTLTLCDVEVRISSCVYVQITVQDDSGDYVLIDLYDWNPVTVCWSERDANRDQLKTNISPSATKSALIAFSDDSNGSTAIINAIVHQRPIIIGGARIGIEVSSPDSALWKGDFYIECHPNYLGGARATFEFVDWELWAASRNVIDRSGFDKGDSQT